MIIQNCDMKLFIERIQNNRLICFGSGQAALNFLGEFEEFHLEKHIICFIDNDKSKWSTKINIHGVDIDILPITQIINGNTENIIILITCSDYPNIIAQLEAMEQLHNTDVYIYNLLREAQYKIQYKDRNLPTSLRLSSDIKIPKVIHYCWFGRNPIPDRNKKWMESWYKFCPGYQIIEWNEDNYDIRQNKYIEQAYSYGKWAFVSDFTRLDILYKYGGIYLDTDVELIKNLDNLLYQDGFCGFQNMKEVATGLGIGAIKGLEIIKEMKDMYDNISFTFEDNSLNYTSCVVYQTELLKKYGLKLNGKFQIVEGMTVYPEQVLSGKSLLTRAINITEYTYSIHHYEGSWKDENHKLKKRQIEALLYNITSEKYTIG